MNEQSANKKRRLVGKKAEPTAEELEFIYSCLVRKLSDSEVLEEMRGEEGLPLRGSGFIKRRRREFNAAKKVLEIQIKEQNDPLLIEAKRQHRKDLISVAEVLLKDLSNLRPEGRGYIYDWATDKDPLIMRHKDVVEELCHNIGNANIMCHDYNLFDYFLLHVMPNNPTIKELYKYGKENPIELINMLKLAVKKGFQGKCPVCKDW